MADPGEHRDGTGLERKIPAAGRPWTVGDVAMVADGHWAVGARCGRWDEGAVVEERIAEGRRVELTVEELARAVGSRIGDAHRDEDLA
ncbi:hypothetical protein ACWC9U_29025 [Streptomyces sp. 900116325]